MLVLSLDTTNRAGSAAVWRDGRTLAESIGDPGRTHGQRLPLDLLDLLASQRLAIAAVDLYAVAAGPGSFTGLRVGIATIQGLAFANDKPLVGVSTLEAVALAGLRASTPAAEQLIGVWMDAQRDEVFSALYGVTPDQAARDERSLRIVEAAAVDRPESTLDRWRSLVGDRQVVFIGEGANRYLRAIEVERGVRASVIVEAPALAGLIAEIAARRAAAGEATRPHAIKPVYVRRPDAEIARDRSRSAT